MPQVVKQDKVIRLTNRILKGQSYKRAMMAEGYKESTASIPQVNATIKEVKKNIKKVMKKYEITTDMVIQGLAREAFDEKNKASDRITAQSWLGKHLKLFTENIEVSHNLPLINKTNKELQDKIEELRTKRLNNDTMLNDNKKPDIPYNTQIIDTVDVK